MKSLSKITLFAALTAVTATACQKEDSSIDTPSGKLVKMTFTAGNPEFKPEVRTEIDGLTPYWSVGDQIGISTDGTKSNYPFTNDATERAATTTFSGNANISSTIYAYYPFTANGIDKVGDNTGAKVDLPANQTPTASSFDGKADILVSKPLTLDSEGQQVANLEFRRLSAIVKVVLKDQSTGAKLADQHVSSLSITTDGDNTLAGRVVVDLLNYTMYAPYYNGSNTVTATYTTNTEYVINGVSGTYLSVYPRLLAAGSKLVVEAATEGYVIKKEIVLSNEIDLETGKITTLNVNLSDEHITAAATGLSLPFTDDFSDLTGNGSAANILSRKDKNGNDLYSAANSYVYQYNSPHGLRMSSSDNSGYIVTSELDLSAPFSVLISAKVWPKDTSGIKVTAGESAAITTADLTEEFKSYLLKFDAQNSKTKIRIEPSAAKERIIIESIQIVPGHDITLPPVLKITSETTLSVPAKSTIKTINYTVENPTNGVSVVASSDVSWLNSFVYNVDGVSFTIDANQGEERSGTITLSYEGAEAQTVSVTQTKPGAVMWETETFENYTVPSATSYGSSGTFNGVTTGTPQWSYNGCGNPNQANTDKTALANAGVVVINDKYAAIGKNGSMSVTIPGGITALKFNALTSSKGSATVTITANGATAASITIPGNSKSAFEIPTIDCQGYDATITIKQNNQNRTTIGDITWQPAN